MFAVYSPPVVLLRRVLAVFFMIFTWPCVFIPSVRARYGSLLHRFWVKEGDKPVWLMGLEQGNEQTEKSIDLG